MSAVIARGSATRKANMEERRARILDAARELISEDGFAGFNLRQLASVAEVTVPTIYNLIGNKDELVASLFDASLSPFENMQYIADDGDLIASFESFFERVVEMLAAKPNYYRAEFRYKEHIKAMGDPIAREIEARIESIAIEASRQARQAGVLLGNIDSALLGRQLDRCFRVAYQDWATGAISLSAFKHQAIVSTCICYAADATPEMRERIVTRLQQLEAAQ